LIITFKKLYAHLNLWHEIIDVVDEVSGLLYERVEPGGLHGLLAVLAACEKVLGHRVYNREKPARKWLVRSNYIKGKFCVSVCVSVRYRTYLNIIRMGSKLLGVLRKTLRWFPTGQMLKKQLILKNRIFYTGNGRKTGKRTGTETKTGTGAGTRTGR
jgi:hypothetical protein